MDENLTHAEIAALLAPFALDAVEPDERDAVAAHVSGCAPCAAELDEYRKAADDLDRSATLGPDDWDDLAGRR